MEETKYIAWNAEDGVYLGHCLGMGFWSNVDSVGQNAAPVFDSADEIRAHFSQAEHPITCEALPVTVKAGERYITADALAAQGKPTWEVERFN